MALPLLGSLEALLKRLARTVPTVDSARAEAMLEDVSDEVRTETGRTWCTDAGELDAARPGILAVITLRAAERAMRNPAALASEGLGDYRRSFPEGGQPSGGVYLTDGERRLLAVAIGAAGLVSVPIERDVLISDTTWLGDQYGGDLMAWQEPL
jgi:hypothetical protein